MKAKVAYLGAGCCCGCSGFLAILAWWVVTAQIIQTIYETVEDMQHIDSPYDTNENPLAESKEFESWEQRDDGTHYAYSVFTVTNAADVVSNGAMPQVQELGPIYMVQFSRKLHDQADKDYWNAEGIARYRTQYMNYLNNDTCDSACLQLLDQSIVIANPAWATFSATGLDTPLIIMLFLGGILQQAVLAGTAAADIPAYAVGQLMGASTGPNATANGIDADQSEATAMVGIVGSTTMTVLEQIGALAQFLAGAQAAATGAATECALGTLTLTAARCTVLLTALAVAPPANGKLGPTWQTLMTLHANAYGTGAAAPVFLSVQAKQLLAYQGGFVDPMTQMPVDMPAALNIENPTNVEAQQMGSSYGEMGTGVFVMYNGFGTDCRVDADCCPGGQCALLSSQDACAANPPTNCQPLTYMYRAAGAIPGANFGKGSSNFPVGTKYDVMINGAHLEFQLVSEGTEDIGGKPLKYLEARMSKVWRRLENCDGTGTDSPGFDCDGPLGTYNYGPQNGGTPLYAALPMFDQSLQEDAAGQNAGQVAGWDPASRVAMTYCSGNSWCDYNRPEKFRSYFKIEPETGKTYEVSLSGLFTQRIGASPFQPNTQDAVVPLFLYQAQLGASQDLRKQLADLQAAPDFFGMICLALAIAGVGGMLIGFACCGFAVYKGNKKDPSEERV
jgi:hypothetical protein